MRQTVGIWPSYPLIYNFLNDDLMQNYIPFRALKNPNLLISNLKARDYNIRAITVDIAAHGLRMQNLRTNTQ
jgi:hypothetical protein